MTTLYHITTETAWSAAIDAGAYRGDTLETEGFIHCSTAAQVAEVANRLFLGRDDLLLLVIDEAAVGPRVVYENTEGGAEQYPHVYGPLNLDAVQTTMPYHARDGRFGPPSTDVDRRSGATEDST